MAEHAQEGHEEHHGMGHVVSPRVLLTVFGILLTLTVVTVLATKVDLGSSWNLFVAVLIATVKASLVCAYFMHLRYDKLMHTLVFLSALLFFLLFVGFCLMDRSQYLEQIRWDENTDTRF